MRKAKSITGEARSPISLGSWSVPSSKASSPHAQVAPAIMILVTLLLIMLLLVMVLAMQTLLLAMLSFSTMHKSRHSWQVHVTAEVAAEQTMLTSCRACNVWF